MKKNFALIRAAGYIAPRYMKAVTDTEPRKGFYLYCYFEDKKTSDEFDNAQNLLHDFRSWDSVIREFEIIGEQVLT